MSFPGQLFAQQGGNDATLMRFHETLRNAFREEAVQEAERTAVAGSLAEGRDLAAEVRRLQRERPGARAERAA